MMISLTSTEVKGYMVAEEHNFILEMKNKIEHWIVLFWQNIITQHVVKEIENKIKKISMFSERLASKIWHQQSKMLLSKLIAHRMVLVCEL